MRPGSPVGASEAAGPALCPGQYLPACGNGSRTGGIHFADLRRWPKSGSPAFDRSAHRFPSGAAPPFPKTDALSASAANRAGIPAAYRKPFPVRHAEQPEKLFKALGLAILGDDPRTLSIPASRWQKLENRLTGLSRKTLADTLSAGAAALCSALEPPPALPLHTQTTAQNLLPRLRAALQGGTTAHLFLSL